MLLARKYLPVAVTVIAWVGSVALAILDIYFVRQIVFSLLARFRPDYFRAVFIGDTAVMIGAVIVVIYFIWSGEYLIKLRNLGKTWSLLGKVYAVLLLIPIVAYFMG